MWPWALRACFRVIWQVEPGKIVSARRAWSQVWTVGLIVEIKLRFPTSPGVATSVNTQTQVLKTSFFIIKLFKLSATIHSLIFILKLKITDLVFCQVHPTWCLTSLLLAPRLDVWPLVCCSVPSRSLEPGMKQQLNAFRNKNLPECNTTSTNWFFIHPCHYVLTGKHQC